MGAYCSSDENKSNLKKKFTIRNKVHIDKERNIEINNRILVQQSYGDPFKKYKVLGLIAEGSGGKIYLVQHRDINLQRVMKVIETNNSNDYEIEINLLKSLDHPNILKIFEYFQVEEKIYLVLDYCKDGNLFEILKSKNIFKEREACFIIYQILLALNYCHSMKLVHRDIKPENIMVSSVDSNGYCQIKLIDFDKAELLNNGNLNEVVGNFLYIAPEVIDEDYNEKCDVWSAGVILYELLSGHVPFLGDNQPDTCKLILDCKLNFDGNCWQSISSEAKDLISRMLKKNPSKRISAKEALIHPWIKEMIDKENWNGTKPELFQAFLRNLKSFRQSYKIPLVSSMVIVHSLTQTEDIKEMEKVFRNLDSDNDGRLNKADFKKLLDISTKEDTTLNGEMLEIFNNCDIDSSGFIEFEEFFCACIDKRKLIKDNYLKLAFDFFDKDGSKVITLKDLQLALGGGGEKVVSMNLVVKMLGEIDRSNDGRISYEEFNRFMRRLILNKPL
jgi:calcium-dependent protein kinase